MRIEPVSEGTGSSLQPRAYEQLASARFTSIRRDVPVHRSEPSYDGVTFRPALVADIEDSPVPAQPRQEAPVYATTALSSGPPTSPRTAAVATRLGKVDADGDGWVDSFDLPFDYFRIQRQASFAPQRQSGVQAI